MADDYAGNASTTGVLPIGSSATGTLEVSGDTDWFAISLVKGLHYQFARAAGAGFNGSANLLTESLVNPNGGLITSNNSNGLISYTATTTGLLYLSVSDSSGTGAYTLTAAPLDDYTGDSSTSGILPIGGSTTGTLESAGDTDEFAVSVVKGLHYQFTRAAGPGFSGSANLLTEGLLNANGGLITNNNSNGLISYTATTTGLLFLSVSDSSGTGAYTLTSAPLDDYAGDSSTSGSVPIGGSASGTLETAGDTDDFAISLVNGAHYLFTLTAANGFAGSANLLSESLISQSGNLIQTSDSTGHIAYTATATGTFYLSVSDSSGTGSYLISTASTMPSVPVYRFFDSNTGTQFLTSSLSEKNTVLATRPDLVNEGVGLNAAASTDPSASPVYRFFDTIYGTHFFTSSADEKNTIQATRSDLSYEGIGFNEYANQIAGSTPVYRFFDSNRGTHFFTGSSSERATILATRADLVPEGISFYSPAT